MTKSVHIYGLNDHGIAAALLAQEKGVAVTASDLNGEPDFAARVRGRLPGVALTFGEHPVSQLKAAEQVVVSPGVVQNAETWRAVTTAANWISTVDFACEVNLRPNPKIIVTGSYGKTTLCALLQSCLLRAGRPALVAGSHEQPVCRLRPAGAGDYLIFELDYQQLVAAKTLRAEAAVILNIHPEGNVFGSEDLYVRTKLMAAGLLQEAGPALVTPAVMELAAAQGLDVGPWQVIAADSDQDFGLIPAEAAALLSALLVALELPPPGPHDWLEIAAALPPGRRNLVPVDAKLDLINDGAAKGPAAVAHLAEQLATLPNAILITACPEVRIDGLRTVILADDGAEALAAAVQAALALAEPGLADLDKVVLAYSPGVVTVGAGVPSIRHRIDLFEQFARQYSRQR